MQPRADPVEHGLGAGGQRGRDAVGVAERQHLTRGSQACNLTPSAATASIQALEGRYGTKLFHRVGRRLELSEGGRAFLPEARAVLATVTNAKAMASAIEGLAVRGRLIVVGVDAEPIQFSPLQLIDASRSIVGHASGASIDSQDTLAFSALSGVRAMIETMPLTRAPEAYARMMRGDARFRMVLTMS